MRLLNIRRERQVKINRRIEVKLVALVSLTARTNYLLGCHVLVSRQEQSLMNHLLILRNATSYSIKSLFLTPGFQLGTAMPVVRL